jgi:hypothetical protein
VSAREEHAREGVSGVDACAPYRCRRPSDRCGRGHAARLGAPV